MTMMMPLCSATFPDLQLHFFVIIAVVVVVVVMMQTLRELRYQQ